MEKKRKGVTSGVGHETRDPREMDVVADSGTHGQHQIH